LFDRPLPAAELIQRLRSYPGRSNNHSPDNVANSP
jgi:hypothetical protein